MRSRQQTYWVELGGCGTRRYLADESELLLLAELLIFPRWDVYLAS